MTAKIEPLSTEELEALRYQDYGSDMERHRLIATIDAERKRAEAYRADADKEWGASATERSILAERIKVLEQRLRVHGIDGAEPLDADRVVDVRRFHEAQAALLAEKTKNDKLLKILATQLSVITDTQILSPVQCSTLLAEIHRRNMLE